MKYFIILLIGFSFFVFSISAKSQIANWITPGIWQYVNGNDTVTMYFQQAQSIQKGNESIKVQLGFHRYVKNGVQMESSLNFINSMYTDKHFSMLVPAFWPADLKNQCVFHDLTIQKNREIYFTKVNATTVNVYIGYIHGVYNYAPAGFTLPRHFTLIKQ